MKYDRLDQQYWHNQIGRIETSRATINTSSSVTNIGRTIPGVDDLVFGAGRRLHAAVLFIDICSFSSRYSETRQEQDMILRILTFFFSEMVKIAEEYGGVVEKNTGDGLMAYFEDSGGTNPISGSQKAIACALTMLYTTENALNTVIANSNQDPIELRIGIESGNITIAKLGAARRFGSVAAIGTTANMASKILNIVKPGEIIIGVRAKNDLPNLWQMSYCQQITVPSGWVYRQTGAEYPFYYYKGRWITPR